MAHDRRSDPLAILAQSMRRMADLRLDDVTRGLENFANPSARAMLDSMGRTRDEQVENLAAMMRNSAEADIAEMGEIFGLAMAKLAEERAAGHQRPSGEDPQRVVRPAAQPRRRRGQTAAEWRQQRRWVSVPCPSVLELSPAPRPLAAEATAEQRVDDPPLDIA